MKLIMLGPPGSGKGTRAAMLKERLGVPAISTGTILRSEIAAGTDIGIKADEFISRGQLVPDDIILDIIERRFKQPDCEKGFILDGFPRTLAQAQALKDKGIEIDAVIELVISDEDIIKRMAGRRICKRCDAVYHTEGKKPVKDGICDECGGELYIRVDDAPETVRSRLVTYHKSTEPLLEFYKDLIKKIDGAGSLSDAPQKMLEALGL